MKRKSTLLIALLSDLWLTEAHAQQAESPRETPVAVESKSIDKLLIMMMIKDFAHMVCRLGHNAPSLNSSVMARRTRMLICLLLSVFSFSTSYAQATEPSLILASPIKFVDEDKNALSELEKGKSYNFNVTVKNNGTARWSGALYLRNGSNIIEAWSGVTINAGTSSSFSGKYTPTSVGTFSPALYYQTGGVGAGYKVNEGNYSNPATFTVVERQEPAIVPEINVTFSTNKLSFGEVEIGKSKSLTFTITNNSNVDVRIGGFGFGSEISMDWNGGVLAVGETKTVTATFTPTRKSSSSSGTMVRVYYGENDDYKMYDFYASGSGIEATDPIEPADPTDPESSGPQLVVWQKDGARVVFNLSEKPRVAWEADVVRVESDAAHAEFDIEDIRKMTYDLPNPDAIRPVAQAGMPFRMADRSITFIPSDKDMNVMVVSINGQVVKKQTVHRNEYTTVSLADLTRGVYLISVNGVTFKINIR